MSPSPYNTRSTSLRSAGDKRMKSTPHGSPATQRPDDNEMASSHQGGPTASTQRPGDDTMDSSHQERAAASRQRPRSKVFAKLQVRQVQNIEHDMRTTFIPELPFPVATMGVIIYCPGAISTSIVVQYAPIAISSFEAVFHAQDNILYIATQIRLPLWMREHDHNPSIDQENQLARCLKVSRDTLFTQLNLGNQSDDLGSTPLEVGSRVVMRNDGFNLLPQHLEALCNFCQFVVDDISSHYPIRADIDRVAMQRKERLKVFATRREFEKFYENYCVQMAAEDFKWMRLPSPYDTARLGKDFADVPSWMYDGSKTPPATNAREELSFIERAIGLGNRSSARFSPSRGSTISIEEEELRGGRRGIAKEREISPSRDSTISIEEEKLRGGRRGIAKEREISPSRDSTISMEEEAIEAALPKKRKKTEVEGSAGYKKI